MTRFRRYARYAGIYVLVSGAAFFCIGVGLQTWLMLR